MRLTTAWAVVSMTLAATLASAEVRLSRSKAGPEVSVTISGRGIWTPRGAVDASTLNPSGDLLGDGTPACASTTREVAVAWVAGGGQGIRIATGDREWRPIRTIATRHGAGRPSVMRVSDSWFVAWAEIESQTTTIARIDPHGRVTQGHLSGVLIGAFQAPGSASLLVSTGGGIDIVGITVPIPEPEPTPFLVVGQWTLMANVPDEAAALDLGFDVIADDDVTALTWWPDDRTLAYVELTDDGPAFPVRTLRAHGNGEGRPASLQREALRDLGAR